MEEWKDGRRENGKRENEESNGGWLVISAR